MTGRILLLTWSLGPLVLEEAVLCQGRAASKEEPREAQAYGNCTLCTPSICLSVCLSTYLSVCPSACSSVYLSICVSLYLSVYLSACLSIYLSVWFGPGQLVSDPWPVAKHVKDAACQNRQALAKQVSRRVVPYGQASFCLCILVHVHIHPYLCVHT